jgi:acetoin utilization protein AcuB
MNLADIKVEEYTSPTVVTINSQETLDRALELMQENGIRHLPVISDQEVTGIISERDVLSNIGKNWTNLMKVEDVMSTNLVSVSKNESLGDVAYQLSSQKIGSALVLDDDESLYGIFTTTDALNALVEIFYPLPGTSV